MAVRHLLDGVGIFILHLGVLQQYLRGGDWLFDVNLPGLKLVSQGYQKLTSSLRRCGVGEIVDSRRGLTENFIWIWGARHFAQQWQAFSRVNNGQTD